MKQLLGLNLTRLLSQMSVKEEWGDGLNSGIRQKKISEQNWFSTRVLFQKVELAKTEAVNHELKF